MTATRAKIGNKRSSARLAAVQALYQMDSAGSDTEETISEFESYRLGKKIGGEHYAPADVSFFRDIVRGVVENQRELDPLIDNRLATGWPLMRIDLTLRQILRAGLYEIQHKRDVPAKAAIVEYVDVAQAFFDNGEEPKVVNALLDALARELRPQDFGKTKAR